MLKDTNSGTMRPYMVLYRDGIIQTKRLMTPDLQKKLTEQTVKVLVNETEEDKELYDSLNIPEMSQDEYGQLRFWKEYQYSQWQEKAVAELEQDMKNPKIKELSRKISALDEKISDLEDVEGRVKQKVAEKRVEMLEKQKSKLEKQQKAIKDRIALKQKSIDRSFKILRGELK